MENNFVIRRMGDNDVHGVVEVHLGAFPGFFLTFLGKDFLSLYYRDIVNSPYGVALVCDKNGVIFGFVTGITNSKRFYSDYIKKNWLKLTFISLKAFIRKPKSIYKLFQGFFYPRKSTESGSDINLTSIFKCVEIVLIYIV